MIKNNMIKTRGISLRWITHACYEIILPNGKHLLMDPYITAPVSPEKFRIDEIEQVDYVLITHTHFDHIGDLKYIVEKFHPIVIAGAETAFDLVNMLDGDRNSIFTANTGETMYFDDIRIDISRAKHTSLTRFTPCNVTTLKEHMGDRVAGADNLGLQGTLEGLDYMITTGNNLRILFASGYFGFKNSVRISEEGYPDIVLRQVSNELEPEPYGEVLANYHAQLILPFHHEGTVNNRDYDIQEYMRRANESMQKIEPLSTLFCPDPFQWYDVQMNVTPRMV